MGRPKQVKRGSKRRTEKNIILIGAEGKNKTEKMYFTELGKDFRDRYLIKFAKGNSTDPVGIVRDTVKDAKKECIDEDDIAFAVFDTDADAGKQRLVDEAVALASKDDVRVITSTPCFEIWYLLHFRYSTGAFINSKKAVEELQKYIPEYEKNSNVYSELRKSLEDAIANAERLDAYHKERGLREKSVERNPSTDVFEVINILREKNNS